MLETENINMEHTSWEALPNDRSPTVSNLRVNSCKRQLSSPGCLNVFLLLALVTAISVILYFVISPLIQTSHSEWVQTEVSTFCGYVHGEKSDGVVSFLGIPYALPPVNENRFKRPVELTTDELCRKAWGSVGKKAIFNATSYKPPCLQLVPVTDEIIGNEDCLYLNVFVPTASSQKGNELKPVVVIFNGLFFMYGGASGSPVMEGQQPQAEMIKQVDAVHVTFNFRVGPLGFLVHPVIGHTNVGLCDQLAVLRWVRSNIRAFRGDPTKVTLFGYGSGATSALAMSYTKRGQNLFDRLWISAPAVRRPRVSIGEAIDEGKRLLTCGPATWKKCSDGYITDAEDIVRLWEWKEVAAWMRGHYFDLPSVNESERAEEMEFLSRILVDDGDIIDSSTWYETSHPSVPLVLGQTAYEAALFLTPETVPFWNEQAYHHYLRKRFAANREIIEHYTESVNVASSCRGNILPSGPSDVGARLTALITDARCTCPLIGVSRILQPHRNSIYHYYLRSTHPRFDPYFMNSFVALASHGWDGMVYLRGYDTHSEFMASTQGDIVEDNFQHRIRQLSNILNAAMHEFSRTGVISNFASADGTQVHINLIDEGIICRPANFVRERCALWEELTGGDLMRFAWQH
ncbi:unnamed protein product [Dicrocoelium dendriticum]|nr:unnamed protein product [Dicrocoelium dendriticum]